jgi:hypothetical protein
MPSTADEKHQQEDVAEIQRLFGKIIRCGFFFKRASCFGFKYPNVGENKD